MIVNSWINRAVKLLIFQYPQFWKLNSQSLLDTVRGFQVHIHNTLNTRVLRMFTFFQAGSCGQRRYKWQVDETNPVPGRAGNS
jgi:hypothetical protein